MIKESDGSSAGCHSSRSDAIKQQRALYAQESRMASMYAELDALPDEVLEENLAELEEIAAPVMASSRVVKIEIPTDEALTASVMQQMERMSERQARTDQALVAALEAIGAKESVVNVHASPITIEPTPVTIHNETPEVRVEVPAPVVNVAAAEVVVPPTEVTVNLPETRKTVTFERDPLTQQVTRAEVTEA